MPLIVHSDVTQPAWNSILSQPDSVLQDTCERVLSRLDVEFTERAVEISALLTDNAEQQMLNARYRQKDKPTNVLSFPVHEPHSIARIGPTAPPLMLGDMSFAFETVVEEARLKRIEPVAHFTHLIVHGVLHLLGFDHHNDSAAGEMEALEMEICKSLGLANPYEAH